MHFVINCLAAKKKKCFQWRSIQAKVFLTRFRWKKIFDKSDGKEMYYSEIRVNEFGLMNSTGKLGEEHPAQNHFKMIQKDEQKAMMKIRAKDPPSRII